MTDFSFSTLTEFIAAYAATIIPLLIVLLGLLVVYYVLLVRAILEMLKRRVPGVLLTFSFISLVPFPVSAIMGIMILIIWHYHKKDYQAG